MEKAVDVQCAGRASLLCRYYQRFRNPVKTFTGYYAM